ncbi:enoyl-CoA hydratase/isomerase family protein [Talaromyces pinophilus]|uniref:Enoyl-CoA hydratase/isomerase family protein n=1 Tax=Talaromyces pinophilus TaxID=128442 RepID=A0A0B8N320_TALPI|nr:enoyl-CoA hydratase/isomerase family protein [Talaromyces pinophilus]
MSKLIVVTRATGLQGLGVIDALSANPDRGIRGVTRNKNSETARRHVERGIEMVAADLDDEDSLIKAFVGAMPSSLLQTSMSPSIGHVAAKTPTLKTYFWSTVPAASKLTNGEMRVPYFDVKGAIDEYFKTDQTLNAKAIFLLTGFYPSNFGYPPFALLQYIPYESRLLFFLTMCASIAIQLTAQIAGKGKLQVISVPFEQFGELYGMWGTELGLMVKLWEVAGAPKMWGTVGDGDVMIDSRDLEGAKELFYDSLMRNAIDHPTAEKLYYAILEFENDETQKIGILYGAGGTFCAGFDLHEVAKASTSTSQGSDAGDQYKGPRFNVEADRVQGRNAGPIGPSRLQVRKPLISAVAGYAVAGGLELSLIADLRVAEEDAIFGVFCRRFGVPLIDGGTVRLQAIVGLGRALDMILTGRAVTAQEGLQMGLVNRVVGKGEGLAEAVKIARQLLAFPQMCMNVDRASCYYAAYDATSFEDALRNEFRNGESVIMQEGVHGAALFAAGVGRHGSNI